MKYPLFVTGRNQAPLLMAPARSEGARNAPAFSNATVRRIAPSLLFLRPADSFLESQLREAGSAAHEAGLPIDEVCAAVYHAGISCGYRVTLAVQEVFSNNMPSFPGQTVMTALIMVDLESPLKA